jgi:hypothetical protein
MISLVLDESPERETLIYFGGLKKEADTRHGDENE